jgi:hypothetical protein
LKDKGMVESGSIASDFEMVSPVVEDNDKKNDSLEVSKE